MFSASKALQVVVVLCTYSVSARVLITIQLWVHMDMSTRPEDFELCTRLENITLNKNGFFGVSAATGGLAGK